jgi:hypothetical protein
VPGWFYTSKADSIVYFWWNPERTSLMPVVCFMHIRDARLKEWFEENKHRFATHRAKTEKEGRVYHTEFVIVPEREFPKGTIQWFPFRLAPAHEQLKLNGFTRTAPEAAPNGTARICEHQPDLRKSRSATQPSSSASHRSPTTRPTIY